MVGFGKPFAVWMPQVYMVDGSMDVYHNYISSNHIVPYQCAGQTFHRWHAHNQAGNGPRLNQINESSTWARGYQQRASSFSVPPSPIMLKRSLRGRSRQKILYFLPPYTSPTLAPLRLALCLEDLPVLSFHIPSSCICAPRGLTTTKLALQTAFHHLFHSSRSKP